MRLDRHLWYLIYSYVVDITCMHVTMAMSRKSILHLNGIIPVWHDHIVFMTMELGRLVIDVVWILSLYRCLIV